MIIHLHNHAGWRMRDIDAPSVAEAIRIGLGETAGFLEKEYAGRYRIEHDDPAAEYPKYRIIWDHAEPKTFIFGYPRRKGEEWWSDRFQVGAVDDCDMCGGTGVNHYNPWRQCWACGDKDKEGRGAGKRTPTRAEAGQGEREAE